MKKAMYLLCLLLWQITAMAQDESRINVKEYFLDAEYFFAQEEYLDALHDYLEVYKQEGYAENANLNYRIGACYLNIPGQKDKSIDYFLKAIPNVSSKYKESSLKQKYAPIDAYLYLGNAYRVNNLLSKAIEAYTKYKELSGRTEEIKYADQQISACNTAIEYMDNPVPVRITDLGDSINGASSNYKAVVSGDGFTMAYMTELPFYNAVYVSHYTKHGWTSPENITPEIQSDGDQYVSCITFDGKRLYLTKENAFNSDIYVSDFKNGKWTRSVPVSGQDINTKYWESHVSLSRDDNTMYFASNRKGGYGAMDIYKSQRLANGQWGTPVNLGDVINTSLNEDTPFITENDSILYFSSQGHENMGGYDIFRSKLQASGQWSVPENLHYPINTTDDNLFYYPWHNGRILYASLIRQDGLGKEDIYAIQPQSDKPLNEVLADLLHLNEKPALVAQENQVVPEKVTGESPDSGNKTTTRATENQPANPVQETAHPGPEIAPVKSAAEKEAEILPAAPKTPATAKEINLSPVYFAFDKYDLNQNGETELKKLADVLKQYPDVQINLKGYADSKGPAAYNLKLSQKRAEMAREYLINQGIAAARLHATGKGESDFAAINNNSDGTDNPEGRKLNRRVEYEVLGKDKTEIRIILPAVPEKLRVKEKSH